MQNFTNTKSKRFDLVLKTFRVTNRMRQTFNWNLWEMSLEHTLKCFKKVLTKRSTKTLQMRFPIVIAKTFKSHHGKNVFLWPIGNVTEHTFYMLTKRFGKTLSQNVSNTFSDSIEKYVLLGHIQNVIKTLFQNVNNSIRYNVATERLESVFKSYCLYKTSPKPNQNVMIYFWKRFVFAGIISADLFLFPKSLLVVHNHFLT